MTTLLVHIIWMLFIGILCSIAAQPTGTMQPSAIPTFRPTVYDPHALRFNYDIGTGNLTIYFDVLVTVGTFNISKIYLQSKKVGDLQTTTFRLKGAYNNLARQGNRTAATIMLQANDYAKLRTKSNVATSSLNTFLVMDDGAVLSSFGAESVAVPASNAMRVDSLVMDTQPPYLSNYTLNMNLGLITLTFSEPVNPSTFTLDGLALQRSRNVKVTDETLDVYYPLIVDSETKITEISNYNRTIEAYLGQFNMNEIKFYVGLATTRESTFLSAWKPFVEDLSGNNVSLIAFDMLHGIPPKEYHADYTPPYLRHWDYDANRGSFALFFSETIYIIFFNFAGITLYDGVGRYMRVENPVNLTRRNDDVVRLTLNPDQLNELNSLGQFYTQPSNTFIILDQGIVVDTADTQNSYSSNLATELHPMRVRSFQYDLVRPELASFSLDLRNGIMLLTFTKTVKISSFDITRITLQSEDNLQVGTEFVELKVSDATVTTTRNGHILQLALSLPFLKHVRQFLYLGKAVDFTYISIHRLLVTDTAPTPNYVIDITRGRALKAISMVPDIEEPTLVEWQMDLNSNVLVLNFSKPVELDTFNLAEATLTSDSRLLPSTRKILLDNTFVVRRVGEKALGVVIKIPYTAELTMKSSLDFCTSPSNCFLSFTSQFVKSIKTITESASMKKDYIDIIPVNFVPCGSYRNDANEPRVESFALDLNRLVIKLKFNKPVITNDFNMSQILLSSSSDIHRKIDNSFVGIGVNSTYLDPFCIAEETINGTVVIYLSGAVYRHLQLIPLLGASTLNTFLYFGSRAVHDVAGNYMDGTLLQADQLVPDLTGPQLRGVYLHPTTDNITIYINEVVNMSSVNLRRIRLISTSGLQLDLSGGLIVERSLDTVDKSSTFVVNLGPIRTRLSSNFMALNQFTTNLFLSDYFSMSDSSPNSNKALAVSSLNVMRDGMDVVSFTLNMQKGFVLIELSFYKTIQSLTASKFIFRSKDGSVSYGLTSIPKYELYPTGPGIRLYLAAVDKKRLQNSIPLTSKESFVLLVDRDAIVDRNSKSLANTVTLPCKQLIQDKQSPILSSYFLNLAEGYLLMTFNKDIVVDTLDLDQTIELVDSRSSVTKSFVIDNLPFKASKALDVDIRIDLNVGYPVTDREKLLLQYPLGSQGNVYLVMQKGVVYDNANPPNPSEAIILRDGLEPQILIPDVLSPTLTGFDLQLSERMLTLNLSESINIHSIKMNLFTLASSRDIRTATFYRLTESSKPVDYEPGPFVKIKLSDEDINNMMYVAPRLILSADITYLSVESGAFQDLATPNHGNDNDPVYFRYGLPVKRYVADYVPPVLMSYNFSIPDRILEMSFSEIVNCETLRTERIMFQPYQFLGERRKRSINFVGNAITNEKTDNDEANVVYLSAESYCEVERQQMYDTKIRVVVSYSDLYRIKSMYTVLKSQNSTFLRLQADAIRDAFGNGNEEMKDSEAMEATRYEGDVISPRLLAFSLSNINMMTLFFNEPVNYNTLRVDNIYFQDHKVSDLQTRGYNLSLAYLYRVDAFKTKIEIQLDYDVDRMKINSNLFKSQYQTNIHLPTPLVFDMAHNPMPAVLRSYALTVGPRLINWDLNLDEGYAMIEFSERVQTTFSLVGFRLQNVPFLNTNVLSVIHNTFHAEIYQFTTGNLQAIYMSTYEAGHHWYKMRLNAQDYYHLKLSPILTHLRDNSDTPVADLSALYRDYPLYMTMLNGLTSSIASDNMIPNLENLQVLDIDPLKIRYFVPDVNPPTCFYYDLNINTGTLSLFFNEPVDLTNLKLNEITLFSLDDGNFATLLPEYDYVYNSTADYGSRNLVSLVGETSLQITLSTQDLNDVKDAIVESVNGVLDGLIFTEGAVSDIAGNGIVGNDADHPIAIGTFTPDTTPPQLVNYIFDARDFMITLIFNEIVDADMLKPYHVVFLNDTNNIDHPAKSYVLSNYTLVNQSAPSSSLPLRNIARRTILLDLGYLRRDMFAIEMQPALSNLPASYLYIPVMKDIFGNMINSPIIRQPTQFLANDKLVTIESFDYTVLGGNSAQLTVYFSRIMDVSKVYCSDFILAGDSINPLQIVDLSSISACTLLSTGNSRIMEFTLDLSQFPPTSFGQSPQQTLLLTRASLSLQSKDRYGNSLVAIPQIYALQVGPQLVRTSLNLESGEILLVFSKPMLIASFASLSKLGFYSSTTGKQYFLSSTAYQQSPLLSSYTKKYSHFWINEKYTTNNDTVLAFQMDRYDLIRVKAVDEGKNKYYFALLDDSAIRDMLGVAAPSRLVASNRLRIDRIIPDTKPPVILGVALDLSEEIMTIEFDEPIKLSLFNVTKLRLQSHETVDITTNDDYILTTSPVNGETKASYRLTGGTVTQTAATITIRFVDTDANMIKLNPYFGKNISSTFLSMEYDAGTDLFGNFLESIPSVNARPIDTFVPDTAKPKLLSFIMDMNYEGETYLSMKFNEPVRMSSINVTLLYLQSRFARRDGVFYRLTGGEVVSANSDIVRIRLLPLDLLSVKLIPGLLRRKQSTYLVYSEDLIKDLFGNAVVPELDGAAFPCTEYIVDAVPPKILQAVLNMTEETLTLVMDEPIVLATVDPSQLIMQSKPELPTSAELRALGTYDEIPQDGKKINVLRQQTQDYYDALAFLTYSVSKQTTVRITAPLSTNVTIEFAAADMDSIKSLYPMADGVLTSWMVFRPDGLFDFVGNSLERNYPRNARRVDVFIADAIRPEVETYLLDMNTGKIHLNLSEAVRTESINVAETYLQNDLARRFGVAINLKNCTFVRGSLGNSGMVTISIDAHTMLFLKFNNIGYDAFTSYFSYSDIFALDYNNNRLMPGWDASVVGGKPKAPTTLRPDTTAPKVVRWYLDRSGIQQNKMVQLKIYFDEPVVVSVVSQLSISSYNRNTPVYPLTVLQNNALTLNYSHYNTELTTYLPNYCVTPFKAALTSCTKDFYSFIDNSIAETDKYGLMIAQSTIRDFAKIPNYAESIDIKFYMVAESESDCGVCPYGTYVAKNCSSNVDRVCKSCLPCKEQQYELLSCTPYRDRSCAACTSCRYGEYVVQNCSATQDTVCAQCNKCPTMSYAIRKCALGRDTLCSTCEECSFENAEAKKICESFTGYSSWRAKNCCYDELNRKIPCKDKLSYPYQQVVHPSQTRFQ